MAPEGGGNARRHLQLLVPVDTEAAVTHGHRPDLSLPSFPPPPSLCHPPSDAGRRSALGDTFLCIFISYENAIRMDILWLVGEFAHPPAGRVPGRMDAGVCCVRDGLYGAVCVLSVPELNYS